MEEKISILHKTAKRSPDYGRDPLQFCTEVFKLRDKLAHGKPESVFGSIETDINAAHHLLINNLLQPDWYTSITREWILQAKERFRVLMIYLGDLYGLHESDHLHVSSGGISTDDDHYG
ncbi:MAG: hypothetical protein LBV61_02720 [Burkholderiaceae bacterium]|nr:hypothetical protein [Burkholderiaceae bacterium]